jgi:hypothetical protein
MSYLLASPWPLYLVTALYAVQAIGLYWNGDKPLAVVFLGYTMANFGLLAGMSK